MKKASLFLGFLILILLSACSPVREKLIGRWEYYSNEDHTAGSVFEFQEDGTCLYYEFDSTYNLLYPALSDDNISRFKANSGSLELTYWRSHSDGAWSKEAGRTAVTTEDQQDIRYILSFPSEVELQLTPEGGSETRTFQHVPLPEMPLEARLLLGRNLLYQDLTVVNTERLVGTWQEAYPGYVEVGREHFVEKEAPEQWAVFIQRRDNPDLSIYILVEGESWWGFIRLEKSE